MKKMKSTLGNMVLSLGVITSVAGAILGTTYYLTKEPIAEMSRQMQVNAIRNVTAEFTNNPEDDKWIYRDGDKSYVVYPVFKDSEPVGAAVESFSLSGFSGEIRVMCGFDADGTIRNYEVLSHAETPGLGSKMQEWFRDNTNSRSIIGKNPSEASLYVTKDADMHGEVDAITAATISSRAFLEAIRDAHKAYNKYIEQSQSK